MDGLIVALGYSCAKDHGDGVWYQQSFPYRTELCAPSLELGYKVGGWTFGYAHLVRTSSSGQGVEDVDYDVGSSTCLRNCDSPATYVTKGRVDGLFARYEWRSEGWIAEAGVLAFVPRSEVTVSNWDETGVVAPPYTYRNPREVRVSPSIGLGYEFAPHAAVLARYYTSIKGAGDDGFKSRATLYNGPVLTISVRWVF